MRPRCACSGHCPKHCEPPAALPIHSREADQVGQHQKVEKSMRTKRNEVRGVALHWLSNWTIVPLPSCEPQCATPFPRSRPCT